MLKRREAERAAETIRLHPARVRPDVVLWALALAGWTFLLTEWL